MALTENREVGRLVDGPAESIRTYPLAAGTHVYKGSLVGLNAAGHLQPMADAAQTAAFIGLSYEEVDNGDGADGDQICRVFTQGDFIFELAGAVVTDVTAAVYADGTSDSVTLSAAGNTKVGNVVGLSGTDHVVVRIKQTAA